jgi:hypothetical protein
MKRKYKILLTIVVLLIGIRIALPYVILHFANKKLANMEGYYGHVDDIDLALFRGAYKIKRVFLDKVEGKDTTKFLYIKLTDLAIEWKPIFKGKIVGKVFIDSAVVQITKDKNEPKDIAADTSDFREILTDFMPIEVNRFEMKNSTIVYKDGGSKPPLNMKLTNIHLVALNLQNGYDSSKVLPASIDMTANLYEGKFNANLKLDPFADQPKFDFNTKLTNTNLVLMNNFLKAYAKFDVSRGTFGLYGEVAAKNGNFNGYVKPIIKDLKVLDLSTDEGNLGHKLYEGFIGAVAWILKNKREDQVATKLSFDGKFKDPKMHIGAAIVEVLRNGFIKALRPAIDQEININTVGTKNGEKKGLFKRLFSKEDKDGKNVDGSKKSGKERRKERREKRKKEKNKS